MQTKRQKKKTIFFKILNIKQQRRVTLEKWETNKVSPMIASTYCLREFLQCRERKPKQSPEKFQSWGDGVESPRKSRLLEWQKTVPRKNSIIQRELCRSAEGPIKYWTENWSAHVWRNYPRPGEKPQEIIRKTSIKHSHKAENITCCHQTGKLHNSQGIRQSAHRVLPQQWANINLNCSDLPNKT